MVSSDTRGSHLKNALMKGGEKMAVMREVDNLESEGRCYLLLYKGKPVAEIQLECGKTLDKIEAFQVVKKILQEQKPEFNVKCGRVSFKEI